MMTNTETTEWAVRTDDGKVTPTASRPTRGTRIRYALAGRRLPR